MHADKLYWTVLLPTVLLVALSGTAAAGGGLVSPPVLIDGGQSRALAAADVDLDSDVDLVVSEGTSGVRVFLNTGAGVFQPVARYAATGPRALALGDLDGDLDPDLVILDDTAPRLFVRMNVGAGHFGAPVAYHSVSAPRDVELVDLDGDGRPELVIAGAFDMLVQWNAGDGTFPSAERLDPQICRRETIVSLDADGDGQSDLAVSGGAGVFSFQCCGGLRIVGNDGGALALGAVYIEGSCHDALAAGDVDGDGDTDLVAVYGEGFLIGYTALLNDGSGAFSTGWSISNLELPPRSLDLTDLDGDGDLDQVGGDRAWINDGAGGFGVASVSLVDPPGLGSGLYQALADVDGDGDEDIVLSSSEGLMLLRSLAAD